MLHEWNYSWFMGRSSSWLQKAPDLLGGPSGGRAVGYLLGEGWGPTALDARLIFQDSSGQVLELALRRGAQGCTMNS